jgi:hypothetical protein
MITNQLERLKQDSVELNYFIQRLQKEGNEKRVKAIQKKQQYLEEYIQTMQQVNAMAEAAA